MRRFLSTTFACVVFAGVANASVINSDFSDDLNNWNVEAAGTFITAADPSEYVDVGTDNGSNPYARFTAGEQVTDPVLFGSIDQRITLDANAPLLSFDIVRFADRSSLFDNLTAPFVPGNDVDFFRVFLIDPNALALSAIANIVDIFGNDDIREGAGVAKPPLTITDATDPFFSKTVTADLSNLSVFGNSFVGKDLDLFFVHYNEYDGIRSSFGIDNISFSSKATPNFGVIPLPASFGFLLFGIAGLGFARARSRS
jgi:hypothetical protein